MPDDEQDITEAVPAEDTIPTSTFPILEDEEDEDLNEGESPQEDTEDEG